MNIKISESAKEAIAIAYMNAQCNSEKSPEELTRIYFNALVKVNEECEKIDEEQPKGEQKVYY